MSTQLQAEYFASPEDYLLAERLSERKHEYLAGVIYAMAGGSRGHNRIAGNIFRHLGNQLANAPCEVFSSDLRVRVQKDAAEFYYYPDVTVDCSKSPDASQYAEEPRVIFEVLSPDTERVDRGEKLSNYQSLASLGVYVLVDQFHLAITVYRRRRDGWAMEFLTGRDGLLELPEIGCRLSLISIYERTHLIR